ncbi:MAG: YeeE/YedE family protein [Caulobacterales bacterium]|nr:YeeE/YedE family protein [Caulobacterales bacterium]MCA0372755.1 YeeE/YedE family protein [Pseudomonadota bacterium]
MNFDISVFYYAAIGGALLGVASGLYYLLVGRIFGVSGILFSLFEKPIAIRALSVLGLLAAGLILSKIGALKTIEIKANYIELIIAGFLVGYGSRIANGCTSGHGICGISRFSLRSLVSVIIFMIAAIITVFIKSKLGA